MKKLIAYLMLLSLLLVGCSSGDDEEGGGFGFGGFGGNLKNPDSSAEGTLDPEDIDTTVPVETQPQFQFVPKDPVLPVMGTVRTAVNLRKQPNTDSSRIETLKENVRLEILELELAEDMMWGRTKDGWVSLEYVTLDDSECVIYDRIGPFKALVYADTASIRTGPNRFYASVRTYSKNTRLEVWATCGRWILTELGWVSMDEAYMDCTAGPDGAVRAKINTDNVSLRTDPDSSAPSLREYRRDEELEILFQSGYINGNRWGCTSEGWINMSYVELLFDSRICGTWYRCEDNGYEGYGFLIYVYEFNSDGTYRISDYCYYPAYSDYQLTSGYEYGGAQRGSYTYDGSTLVRTYTMGDNYYGSSQVTNTNTATIKDDKLSVVSGVYTETYRRGDVEDAKDYIHDEYYSSKIQESWIPTTYDISTDTIYIIVRNFKSNGTYEFKEYRYDVAADKYTVVDTTTGNYFYGKNSNYLYMGYNSYQATISSSKLTLWESNYRSVDLKEGTIKTAVKEIKKLIEASKPATPDAQIEPDALLGY